MNSLFSFTRLISPSSSSSRFVKSAAATSFPIPLYTSSAFASPLFQFTQLSNFSKYISKSRAKRLPLTTKRVGKGYYKGKGARTEGFHTSKGKFVGVPSMRTELIVPDLSNFKLKAYIAPGAKRNIRDVNVTVEK